MHSPTRPVGPAGAGGNAVEVLGSAQELDSSPGGPSSSTPAEGKHLHQGGLADPGPAAHALDGSGELMGLPALPPVPDLGGDTNMLQEMEDCFGADDNVDSFLSEAAEAMEPSGDPLMFASSIAAGGATSDGTGKLTASVLGSDPKGFSFVEYGCLRASSSKVVCCHFSPNGKMLCSAGHDKKAVLWDMDTLTMKSTMDEHKLLLTDVRFNATSTRLATSSFDKTVRVWDTTDLGHSAFSPSNPASVRTFTGHTTSVVSLDFHPKEENLLCSCDADGEIRYWSVDREICTRAFKGATTQVRFQPSSGRLLAAAADSVVSIFDVQSEACLRTLEQRHSKPVQSLCWDSTGEFMASVSEDAVRVYALGLGSGGECVHELVSSGSKFHSCTFHPKYPSLLVIGCYQSLELWNMVENKSMVVQGAHEGLIADLAHSDVRGLVASASHDKCVKLWQ